MTFLSLVTREIKIKLTGYYYISTNIAKNFKRPITSSWQVYSALVCFSYTVVYSWYSYFRKLLALLLHFFNHLFLIEG